jgi:hypothetical protein
VHRQRCTRPSALYCQVSRVIRPHAWQPFHDTAGPGRPRWELIPCVLLRPAWRDRRTGGCAIKPAHPQHQHARDQFSARLPDHRPGQESEALEHALRQRPHDRHDEPPSTRQVDREPTPLHGGNDAARHRGLVAPEEVPGMPFGHRGRHRSELDVVHAHAASIQAAAQALEVAAEGSLRGPIGVVARPSSLAGHRRDGCEVPSTLLLEVRRQRLEQGDRAGEVGVDDLPRVDEVGFGASLVRQPSVRQQRPIEPTEGFDRPRHARLSRRELREVGAAVPDHRVPPAAPPMPAASRGRVRRGTTGRHGPHTRRQPPPQSPRLPRGSRCEAASRDAWVPGPVAETSPSRKPSGRPLPGRADRFPRRRGPRGHVICNPDVDPEPRRSLSRLPDLETDPLIPCVGAADFPRNLRPLSRTRHIAPASHHVGAGEESSWSSRPRSARSKPVRTTCSQHAASTSVYGYFAPKGRPKREQRFRCKACRHTFSEPTFRLDCGDRRPEVNAKLFEALVSGTRLPAVGAQPQDGRVALQRKARKLARHAGFLHENLSARLPAGRVYLLDEEETYEHASIRTLTMPVLIEREHWFVVATEVGSSRRLAAQGTERRRLAGSRRTPQRAAARPEPRVRADRDAGPRSPRRQ